MAAFPPSPMLKHKCSKKVYQPAGTGLAVAGITAVVLDKTVVCLGPGS